MTTSDEDPGSLIRSLEDERYAAMLAGDLAALDRLLSARLVYTHSSGGRDTKASYLDRVRARAFVYESIEHPVDQVILAGGAAVVIGAMTGRVHMSGELRTLRNTACAVWMDEGGDWRLVAYQATPMP